MFISNFEKARIEARLKLLEERVEQLGRSLNAVHDVKTMTSMPIVPVNKKPSKAVWNDAKRAEQSARMKKRWADKKATKVQSTPAK
jgi:hypothetical protein